MLVKFKIGKKEVLLAAGSFMFSLLVAELLLRSIFPPFYPAPTRHGAPLPQAQVKNLKVEDSPGNVRTVKVEYFKHGFKRWGDVNTRKKKMLILGDSFTEMFWVSNGEEWYSYLEKEFGDMEFFVFGKGGFGSLQEYMILDDFIDEIRPQSILIEFCNNDLSDNLYDWDRANYARGKRITRPYFERGKIIYRKPEPFPELRKFSAIADRALTFYDNFIYEKSLPEFLLSKKMSAFPRIPVEDQKFFEPKIFKKAAVVTQDIYSMIRARAGDTLPIYLMYASEKNPFLEQLCARNHLIKIPGVTAEFREKEKEGVCLRVVNDGHWNKLGNTLVGQKVVEHFKKEGFADVR